ncbi:hypothetical protein DVH24_006809 [Malus domestica]|uniref:Uncharacterized protein n=1 Tax=Malus domestica TaxID=3750 RepID=A0A498J9Q3_MALDO|nr:hypothetical protein DVH24_006809 [Malus domestica]
MEVSTATLQPSCSFPLRAPRPATRERVSSLSSIRSSPKSISLSYSITKGCDLVVREPVKLRWSSVVAATVGDTTAVPNSCSSGEELPVSDSSNPISVEDQPSGNGEKGEEKGGIGGLDDHKMTRICDKLIEVFLVDKPTPTDWRRLLAFSKEWDDIRPHFYTRCQDRADAEDDPGMKHKLLRLGRKLKEIDEDVQGHNELLKVVRGAQSEISEIVSRRRKDFTQEFFVHLHTVAESYYNNPTEQTALASIGNMCLAAVQAYDSATESIEALNAAELKFQDIIDSPTVDAACRKIDHLAEKNQLDSALVMMITKAWSAAKESSMTKDEVKDVLYHLYVTARGNLQRLMPKEIRILKYLLTIEDPEERLAALHDAFTPGEELEGTDDPGAASHLDEGYCGRLPFQPGRHSNKGSKRPHESKDHSKNGGAEEQTNGRRLIRCFGGMNRKSNCAICENSNLASICAVCVNYRLNEYNNTLKALKSRRDSLYSRLTEVLVAKGKADDQINWRVLQNEKLVRLREKLRRNKEQLVQGKAKIEKASHDRKVKDGVLESALFALGKNRAEQLDKFYPNLICTQNLGHMAITSERLHKQSVVIKQICKLFPQRRVNVDEKKNYGSGGLYDQICNACLPRGLDPHSVPSEELAASLGYMVQLLNLVVQNLAAPALHNSGFAGSCSRIWQRDSYWDARPSSRSNEYPLFIPRQNYCSSSGENSWSDKSSSNNFGVDSIESVRKPHLDSSGGSFNYTSASSHTVETHNDLQRGISLLKKSVACITAYCYNSLCLDVPSEVSTFEAFAKLLATLSSSKEVHSVFSLKLACSRSCKQVQQLNKSVWNVDSAISSTTLLDSAHAMALTKNLYEKNLPNYSTTFLSSTALSDGKNESLIEEWDLVERPTFPPPPSQPEDIEHWTRAMIIDAKRK